MNKKQLYSAPEAELLVVKFEESFLNSVESKSIQKMEYDTDELDF